MENATLADHPDHMLRPGTLHFSYKLRAMTSQGVPKIGYLQQRMSSFLLEYLLGNE